MGEPGCPVQVGCSLQGVPGAIGVPCGGLLNVAGVPSIGGCLCLGAPSRWVLNAGGEVNVPYTGGVLKAVGAPCEIVRVPSTEGMISALEKSKWKPRLTEKLLHSGHPCDLSLGHWR